jgi:hypothetical protein
MSPILVVRLAHEPLIYPCMDLTKYPLEKFFYFLAGVIPGFVALLIYHLAVPGSFSWFFTLGFLGYRTKLSLILLAAFVIGNTLTTFLGALLGAIGGAYGGAIRAKRPYVPPSSFQVAPWRDPRWRLLLKKRLGADAPNDTQFMTDEIFVLRREAINQLPSAECPMALAALNLERTTNHIDDSNWARWYDHYHERMVSEETGQDLTAYVRGSLNFNFETTSLYVLVSAMFIPFLRQWWCLAPAFGWLLLFIAYEYRGFLRATDKWQTLTDQIKYLSRETDRMETSQPR